MINYEVITRIEDLERYRVEWGRLLSVTPHASWFQSFSWFEMRWKHRLETDESLKVFVVKADDRLIGIVPLMVQRKPTALGSIRKLRFPVENWCSFYGALGLDPEMIMSEAANYFRNAQNKGADGFDLIEFTNLPDYRAQGGVPSSSPEPILSGMPTGRSEVSKCSEVAMLYMEGTWDSYWESRKAQKNRRRNVERCARRLSELGEVTYLRSRPEAGSTPDWSHYEACEKLASMSWQDGLVDGNTLHHEEVKPFLRDVHEAAVKEGCSDLTLLMLDGRPVAFTYGYYFQGYLDLMRVGFDPSLAKFAPGNVLWTRLIEDSYALGDKILDYGPSCLDYKKFWMTCLEQTYQVIEYGTSPAAKAMRLARKLKSKIAIGENADHTNEEAKERAAKNRQQQVSEPTGHAVS
ncbi:MAG: GNAT family N-acetyltransferase [Verrucomicrobiales bacterium]|nr:GNAT family N-acetyltransferase [Verrucomicrobiales bacterium]